MASESEPKSAFTEREEGWRMVPLRGLVSNMSVALAKARVIDLRHPFDDRCTGILDMAEECYARTVGRYFEELIKYGGGNRSHILIRELAILMDERLLHVQRFGPNLGLRNTVSESFITDCWDFHYATEASSGQALHVGGRPIITHNGWSQGNSLLIATLLTQRDISNEERVLVHMYDIDQLEVA